MPHQTTPEYSFLEGDPVDAARRLIGCHIVRQLDGETLIGRIVETEAYHQLDAASHSYKGRTPRTDIMFGPAGFLYVYFTYGMHYCMNVVTGPAGEGSAVLIRALEPLSGEAAMQARRGAMPRQQLTNGPGKACQALGITKEQNGHDLRHAPVRLVVQPALPPDAITQTTRIGISKDTDRPWRFYQTGNPFVSRR
ncbi:MAG TPA: DNA-3-methyladenine glycosylase [Candidatus Saccharimonadales bacterium]|nr:DNA-3-methyladenine glycosylase [Candidatus Saccharimonadales bacterium]